MLLILIHLKKKCLLILRQAKLPEMLKQIRLVAIISVICRKQTDALKVLYSAVLQTDRKQNVM